MGGRTALGRDCDAFVGNDALRLKDHIDSRVRRFQLVVVVCQNPHMKCVFQNVCSNYGASTS
jgi:hypothetical protein